MSEQEKIKRISCIFGAGASVDYGLPTMNQLPKAVLDFMEICKSAYLKDHFDLIKKIVRELFGKDLEKEWINYELLLGQLDYFIRNNSIIRIDKSILDRAALELIFKALTKIIFCSIDVKTTKIIENKYILLNNEKELYRSFFDRLWNQILTEKKIPVLSCISFNYDCKLDDEYQDHIGAVLSNITGHNIVPHYLVQIYSFNDAAHLKSGAEYRWSYSRHHELIKIHGSFDWYKCPNCKAIHNFKITNSYSVLHDENEYMKEYSEFFQKLACGICGTKFDHELVAPILGKNENLTARELWDGAFKTLIEAQEIIVIGYSFPDSDLSFKYLLQHALNWNRLNPKITVVDPTTNEAHWDKIKEVFGKSATTQLVQFKGTFEEYINTI